jgi:general secretion pathway protein M
MASANPALALPPLRNDARAQASRFWQARAPREKQLIAAMAVAVGALLLWWIAIQPALRTLREAALEIERLEQQTQQVQLAAAEMQTLRSTSPVPVEQAMAALRAATTRLGDKAKISVQGERATLTFTGIPAEALGTWLSEARNAARARPIEAQMIKSGAGYNGSITVSVGSAT